MFYFGTLKVVLIAFSHDEKRNERINIHCCHTRIYCMAFRWQGLQWQKWKKEPPRKTIQYQLPTNRLIALLLWHLFYIISMYNWDSSYTVYTCIHVYIIQFQVGLSWLHVCRWYFKIVSTNQCPYDCQQEVNIINTNSPFLLLPAA